ncbi:hypothetical protein ACE4V3_04185 [Borrelia recurrentis]|uniref:Uncharacterized conserved protein n=1 Tax=Borrelia recurrentis (strain A1) TaxID=412418 RepID=B5RQK2_BORRA|nr:hypothetical protein [Borrelia recurrentis]ACH94286.1 uncharacterized conserved protein [Borrelia recurrentis A1]
MMIIFLLFICNIFILYSNSLGYTKLDFEYLNLSQKFSLENEIYFSENNTNFGNEIFDKFQFNDDFFYKDIQENKDLNIEKTINSNWGKKVFRFSAISIGAFPIALFLGLYCFDLSYYFNSTGAKSFPYPFAINFKLSKDENFKKFVVSTSVGLAISLIIALIDSLIYS